MNPMNRAVFFNRDKVLDRSGPVSGSGEAIRRLNESGFKVVLLSNQPGVARGEITEDSLQVTDKKMQREMLSAGAYIDAIYHCTHHPDFGLYPHRMDCDCRKPSAGLIFRAKSRLNIDLAESFLVGIDEEDLEMGRSAGLKTIVAKTPSDAVESIFTRGIGAGAGR